MALARAIREHPKDVLRLGLAVWVVADWLFGGAQNSLCGYAEVLSVVIVGVNQVRHDSWTVLLQVVHDRLRLQRKVVQLKKHARLSLERDLHGGVRAEYAAQIEHFRAQLGVLGSKVRAASRAVQSYDTVLADGVCGMYFRCIRRTAEV
jgi:hypothetical protein